MADHFKILVVYYSRTGTTARVADMLGAELGADVERIREPGKHASRLGARGYVRSLLDVMRHHRVEVMPPTHTLHDYDIVVIGTPVWAGSPCAPVQAWLQENSRHLRHVAFFCSFGKRGSESAFVRMSEISHKLPVATCAISAFDMRRGADGTLRERFAASIRRRLKSLQSAEWMI
jgi:flavodoxin